MFDFFNDMFSELDKNFFRYQVNNAKEIVVEGYKSILYIDSEKIILKVGGGELCITGCNLCVKEFCVSTISIQGQILSVQNPAIGEKYDKK